MKKYIFPAVMALILMLTAACSVTPETTVEEALTPAVTSIPSPVISTITSVNDETNPSITVTWDPVDNASFYVFEYESAVDYLSGESEFKSYVTPSNTFTIPSSAFTNSSDMRFIFKVKSAYKPSSSRSIIYSSDSEIKEAVVINTFSISPIIQDNVLTIYSTFPKIKSVLTGENIIQPVIKYYSVGDDNVATELESNTLTLTSAEKKTIRADLIVDDKVVATREVSVANSADYYPPQLKSLKSTTNEKDKITLTWEASPINAGLESYSALMRFYIERKETTADRWASLMNDEGDVIYIDSTLEGGQFTYSDTTPEEGKDYLYRVITQYVLRDNETTISYDEKKEKALVSDISYIQDTKVKSFVIKEGTGFDGEPAAGDATYQIRMSWKTYHALPEGMEFVVSRSEFNFTESINGNADSQKYVEVYRGRDVGVINHFTLTADENKSVHNYTYYIQIAPENSSSDNPKVQAKKMDENGNLVDGIIKTNPSIKEVSFISSINSSTSLCDRVELNWEYNTSAIEEAGLDVTKVSVHILKRTSTDSSYTDITKDEAISGTSYADKDVEAGNTYYYILLPYYNDASSSYNGAQSAETDKTATGAVLGLVKEISATINKSNTSIDVSWTAVDNANGYVVYYREKGKTDWTKGPETAKDATSCTLSSPLEAGKRYEITASAVDSNKNAKSSDSVITEGEILGPVQNLKATGNDNIQADSIIVTWDAVENATDYTVSIFDDTGNKFYNETVQAKNGTTYTLSATSEIIKAYSETNEYTLSRKYYFTVTPKVGSMTSTAEPTKVEGYWVMPPKNITATKASYRDLITISWDKVENADKYVIYYREHGSSDDWTYLNNVSSSTTSINYLNSTDRCDFTVSTIIDGVEGFPQSDFTDESNYGYPLVAPGIVSCVDNGDSFFKLSFREVEGATGYKIIFENNSWELSASDISTTPLTSISAYTADMDDNGLISYYFPRPTADYKVSFTASVAATNKYAAISEKNTTSYKSATVTYLSLSDDELIRIAFNNLHEVFQAADAKFESDWWRTSQKTANISNGFSAATCGGEEIILGTAKFRTKVNGYMDLQNYSQFENIITTHITGSSETRLTCYVKEVVGGYASLTENGLYKISGTIEVQLPYTHGNVTITFTDFDVQKNTGTAVINGTTYNDLSGYTKLL